MVLTNTLLVGFGLLLLICIPSTISDLQGKQSLSAETTITSVKTAIIAELKNATNIDRSSAVTSKPKTDAINNKTVEQKKSRGSTKYTDTFTTTDKTKETQAVPRIKLTTARNDRSLGTNTDKYDSPEFNIENNIYLDTQISDTKHATINKDKHVTEKVWEYGNFGKIVLTTPKTAVFDNKYRQIQEEVTKSFDDILTTPKIEIFDGKYRRIEEDISKTINTELTTPKHEIFDDSFTKMRDDISRSIEANVDSFFNEKKNQVSADAIEKPQSNESKLDYTRYRNIEAVESKIKNKVHKDYNTEIGMHMKSSSDYNNSQAIDAPGIVVNTIPTMKESDIGKKIDLDQGETTLERIAIEKPEKDPTPFANNKIENELIPSGFTEGPEEKPFEHKNIYISKRGSTIHNNEQPIEKSLSTESGIPLDLYPSKSSIKDLTNFDRLNLENDTLASRTVKKDKLSGKMLKKESDLDNKIPKFIPMSNSENISIENAVVTLSGNESNESTTQIFYEVNKYTTSDSVTESDGPELTPSTNEAPETTEPQSLSDVTESGITVKFFEVTEDTSTKSTYLDDITTVYTELTTDAVTKFTETTISIEETTLQTNDNIGVTESFGTTTDLVDNDGLISPTTKLTVDNATKDSETSEASSDNQTITDVTESVSENKETTEQMEITSFAINTDKYSTTTETLIFTNTGTREMDAVTEKRNQSASNITLTTTIVPNIVVTQILVTTDIPISKSSYAHWDPVTESLEKPDHKDNITNQTIENDQAKQNEINLNGEKLDECDNVEDSDDYGENNCKTHTIDEGNDAEVELEENGSQGQHHPHTEENKQPPVILTTSAQVVTDSSTTRMVEFEPTKIDVTTATTTSGNQPVTETNRKIDTTESDVETTARTDSMIGAEGDSDEDSGNGGKIAAIVISTIGGICLLLLVALLIIMKKRQKRFNYGQRCRPVSLDAYSMDNVSIHNSTRRKGVLMASKRSYGNPAFDDPTSPTHLLNISELLKFANNQEGIRSEFDKIPQVTTKTNELPEGCDIKNRYANVIPLPETRVFLSLIEGISGSDYINANYVVGPQGARHYYIACQAPMQNTIEDFWRMVWEQQSKVVLMLTHLYESGVEKCIDYLPPSEVLDCHRLFGDYQVTLKKREVKDKYIISTLQLKNMVSNSWREVAHLWYMGWPEKGVPDEANSLIAFLIEARSCMKAGDNKVKETNNASISNGITPSLSPVIVHCSPGTGRTGTVITCDIAIREFELTRRVDIPRIVHRIRRDRASAVQTKEQYIFIYKVISFYAKKLTGGVFDSF